MLARLEAEVARLADLLQHHVGALVRAVRHVRIEHVGQPLQREADLAVQPLGARLRSVSISPRSAAASASSAAVSAPVRRPAPTCLDSALRRACSSCSAVRLARRSASSASSAAGRRRQPAARQRGVERGGIGADRADVVHRLRPRPASARRSGPR